MLLPVDILSIFELSINYSTHYRLITANLIQCCQCYIIKTPLNLLSQTAPLLSLTARCLIAKSTVKSVRAPRDYANSPAFRNKQSPNLTSQITKSNHNVINCTLPRLKSCHYPECPSLPGTSPLHLLSTRDGHLITMSTQLKRSVHLPRTGHAQYAPPGEPASHTRNTTRNNQPHTHRRTTRDTSLRDDVTRTTF